MCKVFISLGLAYQIDCFDSLRLFREGIEICVCSENVGNLGKFLKGLGSFGKILFEMF